MKRYNKSLQSTHGKTASFRRRRRLLPNCDITNSKDRDIPSAIAYQRIADIENGSSGLPPLRSTNQTDPATLTIADEVGHNGDNEHHAMIDAIEVDNDDDCQDLINAIADLDDDERNEDHQPKSCTTLLPWTNLFSLLCVCGSVRLTAVQHNLLRLTMMWSRPDQRLPSYRTVRRVLFPFLLENCFPISSIITFPIGIQVSQSNPANVNGDGTGIGSVPMNSVGWEARLRIVYPSEWAKHDVITSPLYEAMFSAVSEDTQGSCKQYWSIENCHIVRNKADLLQPTSSWYSNTVTESITARKGTKITSTISRIPAQVHVAISQSYHITPLDRGRFQLSGNIAHIWCATVAGQATTIESGMLSDLSPDQRSIVQLSSQLPPRRGSADSPDNDIGIRAGDMCTLIDCSRPVPNVWICVLVHRFCNVQHGSPSRRILWIRTEMTSPRSWYFHEQTVHEIGLEGNAPVSEGAEQCSPSVGTLENGEKYVVYRMLLYSDDFETTSDYTPNGSNGGCYMIPVNLPPCDRRGRSAVRVISVTPPGISTNQILQAIIPDLVRGSTQGVKGVLPNGETVRIFLDVLGFVGDYPASCHVIDSKTHTANAPCTLCSFKRYSGPDTRASRYGYTVQVNANDPSACRFGDRQEALRRDGVDDETARLLGMTASSSVTDQTCPLIAFQRELHARRNETRTNAQGVQVVNAMFDAYRSNLVAPDHLLTGLAKNIISLLVELTPSNLRSHVDIRICDELRRNGLLPQNSILKSNGRGIASMSLSAVFCTLLVSCPVFEAFHSGTSPPHGSIRCSALTILRRLVSLIAGTYWTPRQDIDGQQACSRRERNDGRFYLSQLLEKAVQYVQSVNELCMKSTIVAKHLDKPNLHRLLELYAHTLPAFGHVNHFMELVFECAHQPLKRCITRGNHRNDHLSAMEHCLGNDWQARLVLLKSEMETSDQIRKQKALRGLKRLLVGTSYASGEESDQGLDQAIEEVFRGPVEYILRLQCTPMNLRSQESSMWVGRGKSFECKGKLRGVGLIDQEESDVLRRIWELYSYINPVGPDSTRKLSLFKEMIRRLKGRHGDFRSTGSGVHRVGTNDAVQILVSSETENECIITKTTDADAIAAIYCVVCIIDDGEHGVVAAVLRCDTEGPLLRRRSRLRPNSVQLVSGIGQLRRVGLFHACHIDRTANLSCCKICDRDRVATHSKTLLEGGAYYYATREMGYPPRMA